MQLRLAGLTCALAVTACIDAPPIGQRDQHVIGGMVTPEGEYPGVGALYMTSFGSATCTGTLIAPNVVLTAAHCVEPKFIGPDIPGFTLVHDTVSSQPPFTPGMRAVQHPMFDISNDPGAGVGTWYDIALLFLADDVTTVPPVRMPRPEEGALLTPGTQLHLVGYGRTSNDTFETGVMFDAMTDLVTRGDTELQISTPGNPQNCHGDSGGPALYDFGCGLTVVGVVSRSADGTGECLGGGIDTRVDAYLTWIAQEAPGVVLPPACVPGQPDAAPPAPDAEDPIEPDAGGPGVDDDDGGGCCSTSRGDATGTALLSLFVGLLLFRRRRAG